MNDGNEIQFHDETTTQQPKGGKNKLGIISLILAGLSIILMFFDSVIFGVLYYLFVIVSFVLSIVALSQIKKKNQTGKVYAILGLIGSILSFILLFVVSAVQIGNMSEQEKLDAIYCPYASECVDNNDGTSSCVYVDDSKITCTSEVLKEDQYK